jgi:hypothetical protein
MSDATFITNMSLYIPYVFQNITGKRISHLFEKYIGKVSRVDLVSRVDRKGKFYNVAYIHFDYWYDNIATQNIQSRILNPNLDAKFVYEDPWHWILLENNGKKHVAGGAGGRKQCINLTDFAEKIVAPDQEYNIQPNYIPDYKSKNIFHTRGHATEIIEKIFKKNSELTSADNIPLSRKEIAISDSLMREFNHYDEWVKRPQPIVLIDYEIEQILDEMDEVERLMETEEFTYFKQENPIAMSCN